MASRLFFPAVLLFSAAALAQEAPDPMCDKYPDADAVLVEGVTETVYAPDGTYTVDDRNWVKLLTEKGCREESEIVIPYNMRLGRAEVCEVTVTRPDGTERRVDISKTMSDATDNSSAKDNIYDPMQRQVTVRIPGLKPGDTMYYRTRREINSPRVENLYAGVSIMEWTSPIEKQIVRFVSPKELPLKTMAVKHSLGNWTYGAHPRPDGSVVHEWVVTNTPQVFAEPNMPAMHTQVQALRVSTASDWREISKWYWNLCANHLEKTSPAITNKVEEILASVPSGSGDIERIRAVYKWVAQEIRYMGLTMEDKSPGYAPHDICITFDNRYGVCRDKAALLAAMLRIAGFDAFPVLIDAGAKMDEEVPLPYFNHAIVAVYDPGAEGANKEGYILMDPTDESSRDLLPSYLDDRSYLVARPDGETLLVSPVTPARCNQVAISGKGRVDKDGILSVNVEIAFSGMNDNVYRSTLIRQRDDERRKLFERIVSAAAPGAELLSFSVEPQDLSLTDAPMSVKFSYRTPEAILDGETRQFLSVPFLSRYFGSANWILEGSTSLDRRKYPLKVSSTAMSSETLEIEFDDRSIRPERLPEDVEISGGYSFVRKFSFADGKLSAVRSLSVESVEFSPSEYDELRESIKRVETEERDRPVLVRDPASGADVKTLRHSVDVHVAGPYEWTVTNHVVKQVLTYDGKKRSAELKYYYNPVWRSIELVSATVSNLDGRVYSVSPAEINTFDATWASGAPRYPASKQLIVNLPSVEIGSVLSYTVATTVTNAPLPYKSVWYFDCREPAERLEYTFSGPGGLEWSRTVDRAKLIPDEPLQAPDILWRDSKIFILGTIADRAERLRAAADVPAANCADIEIEKGADDIGKIDAVRRWMSRNVRIAGPSLDELPLEYQLTAPSAVLRERYATRLDYIRTMVALLKGFGVDASVVFAADDAKSDPALADLYINALSDGSVFSTALCRVVPKGKWPWSRGGKAVWVGTESEWAYTGATVWNGAHFLDPATGETGVIEAAEPSRIDISYEIDIRENGSADVDCLQKQYGAYVDAFRKKYAEMLPEDRSRHFQKILGELSQNATATRELATDTEGYPATLSYSAYIPGYATVKDGIVLVNIPEIAYRYFSITGQKRHTPIGIPSESESSVSVTVVFPKGYGAIEHVPSPYSISDPEGKTGVWHDFRVETETRPDGRLAVTLERIDADRRSRMTGAVFMPLLKEWTRMGLSREYRTISVRRGEGGEED